MVEAQKRTRYYTSADKADLDIKTSVNKIGEIVNLSQELNTLLWDNIYKGETFEQNAELYADICKLAILSNIEIDKAKKEYALDSTKEIGKLKEKYLRLDSKSRYIKPNFFGHLAKTKGYYNSKRKNYLKHHTSMDYVQSVVRKFKIPRCKWDGKNTFIPFVEIIDKSKYKKGAQKRDQIEKIIQRVREMSAQNKAIYTNTSLTSTERYKASSENKAACIDEISGMKISLSTMYYLLREIEKDENKDIAMTLLHTLFASQDGTFYDLILSEKEPVGTLKEDEDGLISLYGIKYSEVKN